MSELTEALVPGMVQTQFDFELPYGYADETGQLHRDGTMRLAYAIDEVSALQDQRVTANGAYLGILILSRVLVRLGGFKPVPVEVVEQLFAPDYEFLQSLYVRVNGIDSIIETECPHCGTRFEIE